MPIQDIILIGGSTGALEALKVVTAGLVVGLPAAVFTSVMALIGPLPAKQAQVYSPRLASPAAVSASTRG